MYELIIDMFTGSDKTVAITGDMDGLTENKPVTNSDFTTTVVCELQ